MLALKTALGPGEAVVRFWGNHNMLKARERFVDAVEGAEHPVVHVAKGVVIQQSYYAYPQEGYRFRGWYDTNGLLLSTEETWLDAYGSSHVLNAVFEESAFEQ